MAKYYVESGNVQMVVHADNARGAAIWVVHRTLSQLMPFLADDNRRVLNQLREPQVLGPKIAAHEQGYGHPDRDEHDTFEIVSEWNRLMVALDKLQAEFQRDATAV